MIGDKWNISKSWEPLPSFTFHFRNPKIPRREMPLLQCCCYTFISLTSSCNCNSSTTIPTPATTKTLRAPISNSSYFHQFRSLPMLFFTSFPRPISEFHQFSPSNSSSSFISPFRVSRQPVNIENHEEEETVNMAKLRVLKQKAEIHGINCDSCTPGQYNHLICPKCGGGWSMETSLSLHINQDWDFIMWRCFRVECGWAGRAFADDRVTCNGANQVNKVNSSRPLTEESLRLEPLGDELIAYFAVRRISKEILRKNAVMQITGNQNVIAFTYRRNGVLISCKYRKTSNKKFWQERGTEKILYGLDDIKEADEIVIVEGEIDKLSMEEAGICNCVSVPDGAPQKVSAKELPSLEKDSRFQYLWNCKEYLEKASRIILATDGDMPGQALAEELALRLGRERCWQVSWPKKDEFSCFKDANEVLKNLGPAALRDIICNAELYRVQNLN